MSMHPYMTSQSNGLAIEYVSGPVDTAHHRRNGTEDTHIRSFSWTGWMSPRSFCVFLTLEVALLALLQQRLMKKGRKHVSHRPDFKQGYRPADWKQALVDLGA